VAAALTAPARGWGANDVSPLKYALLLLALPAEASEFSLTPRARLQLDSVRVDRGAFATTESGVRRFRLGAEGDLPGALRYRVDVELSGDPFVADAWLRRSFGAATVTLGHQRTLNGLEQISSSVSSMFLERAAFNEAADNPRRLGGALAVRLRPDLRLDIGGFGPASSAPRGDSARIGAARLVAFPRAGATQLHIGINAQRRTYREDARAARFRARPYTQIVEQRFVATPRIPAEGDLSLGLEAAAIAGSVWVSAEAQRVSVRGDQGFALWGGYAEAGVFLTGEQRAYAEGMWGRTAPERTLGSGGAGSLAATVRIDHLDLSSPLIDGGRQTGVLASLVWQPVPVARFIVQAARAEVVGGSTPGAFTTLGLRAQLAY
jgi:phosphate-selective porin OprO/OprP